MTRAEEHLILSASFGTTVQVRGWAKHLKEKLGVDFKKVESKPTVHEKHGFAFRCHVTDQIPALQKEMFRPGKASEVVWVDPAAEADQSDAAAAVTSVALFNECPRRYYLSRYLGFEAHASPRGGFVSVEDDAGLQESDETDATTLGRRVHEILAGNAPDGPADGEAQRLADVFLNSDLGQRTARAHRVLREHGVLFPIGDYLLRGQIDLWFEDGEEHLLLDYKTDEVDEGEAIERAKDYSLQIQLYALAMRQAEGRLPSRGVLYFLRPNAAVDVDLSDTALDEAQKTVERFFSAQSTVQFPIAVGPHCLRCPHYRGQCPARLPASARA